MYALLPALAASACPMALVTLGLMYPVPGFQADVDTPLSLRRSCPLFTTLAGATPQILQTSRSR